MWRTWRPNWRHQVNFWGTPENFGVQRFKLAMWKVGGIKIETAAGRQKVFACRHANLWKMEFFCSSACNSKRKSAIMMVHKRWNAGYTWGNKRLLGEKWLRGLFDCVLPAQSWEMAVDIYQITLIPWLGWIFNFEAVRFFRTPSMVFFSLSK